MKRAIIILAVTFIGCSTKTEIDKIVKEKKELYKELANTKYLYTSNLIVFIKRVDSKSFILEINPKDIDYEIKNIECKSGKQIAKIKEINSSRFDWLKSFKIEFAKRVKGVKCSINKEQITF
ncbi:MAG: hypothetical protein GXN91_04180 [Epsilonproteobacteria bacterium]|nr:hypothetical protein [Campylobacterota bacterium]